MGGWRCDAIWSCLGLLFLAGRCIVILPSTDKEWFLLFFMVQTGPFVQIGDSDFLVEYLPPADGRLRCPLPPRLLLRLRSHVDMTAIPKQLLLLLTSLPNL